jgi:5-methylcytosine-specific restriction endonuclease McrA
MDDTFDLFDFIRPPSEKPPERPKPPAPAAAETDDDLEDLCPEPEPVLDDPCDDPEAWCSELSRLFPESDPGYLGRLVGKSSSEFLSVLRDVRGKSPRFVLSLLLQQEYITSDMVRARYDPVAIFDLTRLGIPLHSEMTRGHNGRNTKRYTLDPLAFQARVQQRRHLTREQRLTIFQSHGFRCVLCSPHVVYDYHTLQADHCIPFQLVENRLHEGDGLKAFQPLCPSCNTEKKYACEQDCPRFKNNDPSMCPTCYWASPLDYSHIAGKSYRRLTLVASSPQQIEALAKLERAARKLGL